MCSGQGWLTLGASGKHFTGDVVKLPEAIWCEENKCRGTQSNFLIYLGCPEHKGADWLQKQKWVQWVEGGQVDFVLGEAGLSRAGCRWLGDSAFCLIPGRV